MQRVRKQGGESENAQRTAQAKFTSKSRENEQANDIDDSPAMIAQRKKLHSLFGGAIQRQGAEEEMLQGKFDGVQRIEEEEPLQGKFDAVQRVEDEEPLQGKFSTIQRVEEEEPLHGKFGTAQRVEEEEPLQGKFDAVQRAEEEEPLQGKFATAQMKHDLGEEEFLPGKFGSVQRVDKEGLLQPKVTQREEAPVRPNNTGLPDNLKNGIESLSGMSMDNVKVHYNSSQPAQLNALAYAQGTDIHVAPGQEQHLPHEAWHVVQQAQGRVKPTMQMKEGVPVNDDKSLEHEADVMGAKAVGVSQAAWRDVNHPMVTSKNVANVAQMAWVDANHGGRRWRSTGGDKGFDGKHYVFAPTTDQGWVDWRLERWPGFAKSIPAATLVTGNLSDVLNAGSYANYVVNGERFTVDVTVDCVTINPRNSGNPLSVSNIMITPYDHVRLEGWHNTNGTSVIDHLVCGF